MYGVIEKELISRWTFVRLEIESKMYHRRDKLIFLLTISPLPAGDANRFSGFIRTVAKQKSL